MACGQIKKESKITVPAKEFSYNYGVWSLPTKDDEPAKLRFAEKIEATARVGTCSLNKNTARIGFKLAKAMETYGWENSELQFKAEMGSKSVIFNLGQMFRDMPPGKVSVFGGMELDMSENTDPANKKIILTLWDKDTTCKGGLDFYEASITQAAS